MGQEKRSQFCVLPAALDFLEVFAILQVFGSSFMKSHAADCFTLPALTWNSQAEETPSSTKPFNLQWN